MNSNIEYFKEQFDQLQSAGAKSNPLEQFRQQGFKAFNKYGIPAVKHEEWKYTRIGGLFNKDYFFASTAPVASISAAEINAYRLPDHEKANELVFLNGQYAASLSNLRSAQLKVLPLEQAAATDEYKDIVAKHLGHSSKYLKDGINALNTAFVQNGVFVFVQRSVALDKPVYIYNIAGGQAENVFAQPRSLVYLGENAKAQFVETYASAGQSENFTNQVVEIVVEKNAVLEYYKIQNDVAGNNLVSTTHIRQIGQSHVHTVTVSLNGGIVRNNLNVVMEAAHSEAHLYGLYFQQGQTHIDNHTVVDNVKPHCQSNELYKGVMNDHSTAVFNGKIFVQQEAQKTNAFQSNKNILLSPDATVNSKPQLEIFADDVKCSHGTTTGKLNDEALFYMRSRGIPKDEARSLLLYAFSQDVLSQIKIPSIREYLERVVTEKLTK